MAILANDIFTNIAAGVVTTGGTTAPAAGSVETWTVSATLGTFPNAQSTATAPTQFRIVDQAADYSEVMLVTAATNGTNELSANDSDFETSVAGWSAGTNTTLAQSTLQAYTGTHSAMMTSTFAGSISMLTNSDYAATAGSPYTFSCWMYSPVATTVGLEMDWKDASHTYLDFVANTYNIQASTWTLIVLTGTAVASTARVTPIVIANATATSQNFFADVVQVISPSTWTVTRGADGTTPIAHTAGFTALMIVAAKWLNSAGQGFGSSQSITPSGCLAETMKRSMITNVTQVLLGIDLYLFSIYIPIGTKISNINFYIGNTAATSPTHQWWGLADSGGVQRAHTVDGTTTAMAANTAFTKALVTPYTTTYSGTYYVLQSITASAMPSQLGTSGGYVVVNPTIEPVWFFNADSAATPGTDNTTTYTTTGILASGGDGTAPRYFYLT